MFPIIKYLNYVAKSIGRNQFHCNHLIVCKILTTSRTSVWCISNGGREDHKDHSEKSIYAFHKKKVLRIEQPQWKTKRKNLNSKFTKQKENSRCLIFIDTKAMWGWNGI